MLDDRMAPDTDPVADLVGLADQHPMAGLEIVPDHVAGVDDRMRAQDGARPDPCGERARRVPAGRHTDDDELAHRRGRLIEGDTWIAGECALGDGHRRSMGTARPQSLIDCCAAASTLTTSSPWRPSVKGSRPCRMQSTKCWHSSCKGSGNSRAGIVTS